MGFEENEPAQFYINRAVAILRENAAKHYKYVELYKGEMSQIVALKSFEGRDYFEYVPIASERARNALAVYLAKYKTKEFYVP